MFSEGLKEMFTRFKGETIKFLRVPLPNSSNGLRNFRTQQPVLKGVVSPRLTVPKTIPYPEYGISGMPGDKGKGIYYYSKDEIPKLRKAARLARKMLEFSLKLAKPGVTTDEIDRITHEEIVKNGAYPSPLNYFRYPKSIATSVNEVVCHGIPDNRKLQDGDIISIDVSLFLDGFHGDNCGTVVVGKPNPELERLIQCTKDAVWESIKLCKPGAKTKEIGNFIEDYANKNGYSVIQEFCGHGVGKFLHMNPLIRSGKNKEEVEMKPGMCFTIEPILAEGKNEIYIWNDNWTASTVDGSWSAQIEHQILITDKGHEILTLYEE